MKIISSFAVVVLCLLMTSTDSIAQQITPGFSVKELSAFLVQIESQLPQNGLIIEIGYYKKFVGVSAVTNTNVQGRTFNFWMNNNKWEIQSTDSYYENTTIKHHNPSMSIKDICAFFIQVEGLFPQHEGIVGVEFFGKQIKVKTASRYIPLAGRGHFITFEQTDGNWRKIAESEWIS